MPCYLQTTLTHQLWQVIQLSGLITTNPICVLDNILYLDPPLLLSEKQVNPPYHGYVAISRLLYHIKTTVPLTVKAKPTKNFSSKRKLPYHKICRSACLSPPPFFLFKAFTFYPCVSYFIFLLPLWIPSFWHLSRRYKRDNPQRCCHVSHQKTQRMQRAASQRSALQQ